MLIIGMNCIEKQRRDKLDSIFIQWMRPYEGVVTAPVEVTTEVPSEEEIDPSAPTPSTEPPQPKIFSESDVEQLIVRITDGIKCIDIHRSIKLETLVQAWKRHHTNVRTVVMQSL